MAKTQQIKRPKSDEETKAARQRSDRLRAWMATHQVNGKPVSHGALIRASGLAESLFAGFMARSGRTGDVGLLRGYNVAKLVRGMRTIDPALTGESIARMLGVDADMMDRWIGAEDMAIPDAAPAPELPAAAAAEQTFPQSRTGTRDVLLIAPLQGLLQAPAGWTATVSAEGPGTARLWLYSGQAWSLPGASEPGEGWQAIGWIRALSE